MSILQGRNACSPMDTKPKFAMVAATPLQLLHCAEFVINDVEGSAGNTDLYIVHTFPTAPALSEGAKRSGLYRNVYDLQPRKRKGKLHSKLCTFIDLFFPRMSLRRRSCGQPLAFRKKDYKVICVSSQTTFTIGIHLVFPKAKVYLYDDGIGSYYGSMVHDYNSGLFRKMNRVFFGGKLILEPEAMYLAVPELSRSTSCSVYRKLPSLDAEAMMRVEEMFGYRHNDFYDRHQFVYLTQPFGEMSCIDPTAEGRVVSLMEEYLPNSAARLHPRQKNASFGQLPKDTFENLWELECLKQITDDHVLLSYCSTAQFMPKLMHDAEPHIVFLYKIFGKEPSAALRSLLKEFSALYRKPEHIHVPETAEELARILKMLAHN